MKVWAAISVTAILGLAGSLEGELVSSAESGAGLRFDGSLLDQRGWQRSSDPDDFPLEIEGKSRQLLVGYSDPETKAKIFVIYSEPEGPLPLSSIPSRPSASLLSYLGGDEESSDGWYEGEFLAGGIDAVHWIIRATGDGVTFLPPGKGSRVPTFGLRSILSFGVRGPGREVRRVLISAFLRCRVEEAERLRETYFGFLKSLEPVHRDARIVPQEEIPESNGALDTKFLLARMGALVTRTLPGYVATGDVSLTVEEEELLLEFLRFDPSDALATKILLAGRDSLDLAQLEEGEQEAYAQYLQRVLKSGTDVGAPAEILERYRSRLAEVSPALEVDTSPDKSP